MTRKDFYVVLVTGTRSVLDGTELLELHHALSDLADRARATGRHLVVLEGGATGIDQGARDWAEHWGTICGHFLVARPTWKRLGRWAGPIRNSLMVALQPDIVLAFPRGESRGTRDCIRQAREAGIWVEVYELKD